MTSTMVLKQTVEWKPIFLWFKLGIDPEQTPVQFTVWVPQNMVPTDESKLIARMSGRVVTLLQDVSPLRPIIQGQYMEGTDDKR